MAVPHSKSQVSRDAQPHPKNAPGPFYVVHGCCTACGVPFSEAPELFAYDEADHCYLARQPRSQSEITHALRAAWFSELACIRYRGDDQDVVRRFVELGEASLCDTAAAPDIHPVFRNHVTFDATDPKRAAFGSEDIVLDLQRYLERRNLEWDRYRFSQMSVSGERASFSLAWFEDNYHPIDVVTIHEPIGRWLVRHSPNEKTGARGLSWVIHDWLANDRNFCSIQWYSQEQWLGERKWQETPW